jgi:GNAT superfamily N-acetyltransferase
MEIEEVDARTAPDDLLARLYALELACHDELEPGVPPRSAEEVVAFYRNQPETHTSCHWLAEGGGGAASLYVHGPTASFLRLLVHPERRRLGIGTALLESVLERSRELAVEVLHTHHSTPAGAAFVARHGFVDTQRIVGSILDLRNVDLPEPRLPDGFRLVTWFGRVPDEQLGAYVRARAAMDDAPDPEGMDYPTSTAETVRASEESLARREREMRLTVAIAQDGEVGAFTELRVSRGSTLGFTDDTGTVAAHRGKGLARAVKLESLRRLRDDHPEVGVVTTQNAEENAVMLGLNESIGFRRSSLVTTASIPLEAGRQRPGERPR